MITVIKKKECEQKYLPFGFYYKVKHSAFESKLRFLDTEFKNTTDYENALKSANHTNVLIFRKSLENLNRVEVIDAINIQFNYYNETCIDMFEWLNVTYDLIIKGLNISSELSPEIQSDFKEWFNNKIKSNNKYFEAEIVCYLIGQRNNMNSPTSKQPCYHYIKEVLSKYQLTSIKAKEMVNDYKGNFSPDWNKNIIPFIIDYLKSIDVTNKTQQSSKEIKSKEPTLNQLALYHFYLGTDINKDNANDYLKGTSHKTGAKLKQDFDFFYRYQINRTGSGTNRENNYKLKLFAKVILMLKKTSNKDAVLKAEKELKQFENNIA
jgi:hypothetical protein